MLVAACEGEKPKFTDAGLVDASNVDAEVPVDASVDAEIDAPLPAGRPGNATVTGAVKASSPSYKLYGTLRSGDGSSESPGYQRRGGVTGATQ